MLPLADVADDREQVVAIEPDVGQVDLDGEYRAVLAAMLTLDHERARGPHVIPELPPQRHRKQRIDLGDRQREILLACIAVIAAGPLVDVEEARCLRIEDLDRIVRVIEERAEPEMSLPLLVRAALGEQFVRVIVIAAFGRSGRFGRHGLPFAWATLWDALTGDEVSTFARDTKGRTGSSRKKSQ